MYKGNEGVTRDFVATGIVVWGDRVALLRHRKLGAWLPPGGHIESPELPEAAAVREVYEETGLRVEIVGESEPSGFEHALVRPAGIQLEDIEPGHQHIDLIYFARPVSETVLVANEESTAIGWFTVEEMRRMGVKEEVVAWSEKAIRKIGSVASS